MFIQFVINSLNLNLFCKITWLSVKYHLNRVCSSGDSMDFPMNWL